MLNIRFLVFSLFIVSVLLVLTGCPVQPADDATGDTSAGTVQPKDSDTSSDATTPMDGTAATDTGAEGDETAEGTATGDGTTDASGDASDETADDASTTGGSEDSVDESKGTETDAMNPFPPNGGMWTYDELGTSQNEKVMVLCETDKGKILFEIYPEIAPNSAKAFLALVNAEYYDNTYYHRVISGFVAQGGNPLTSVELKQFTYNKENWPAKVKDKIELEKSVGVVKDEPNYANNDAGTLALAKVGRDKDTYDKDSAGAEFFINLKYNEALDKHFTVFGKVVSGMDVVTKLTQDDIIRSMREMH